MDDESEFSDLLAALGSTQETSGPEDALALKDLEIAELQRNLQALRGMGDGLAELEQRRLAECAELAHQRDIALETARRWCVRAEELEAERAAARQAKPGSEEAAGGDSTARQERHDELEKRFEALSKRHRKLSDRWRALSEGERAAASELEEARAELAESALRTERLEARLARCERDLARRDAALERDRQRLAREKERAAALRAKAREQRERSVARGNELRQSKALLRERDRRIGELAAQWEALSAQLASLAMTWQAGEEPEPGELLELLSSVQGG